MHGLNAILLEKMTVKIISFINAKDVEKSTHPTDPVETDIVPAVRIIKQRCGYIIS